MTIVQFTMGKRHLDTDGRVSQQIESILVCSLDNIGQGLGAPGC